MGNAKNQRTMGRIEIIEEITSDSKLAATFLLRILFLLTITMRELLAENQLDKEKLRIINQINHRILPIAQKLIVNSQGTDQPLSEIVVMIEKSGFTNIMLQSLDESRNLL